ncbi:hypothetical protein BX659_10918 [Orenia metallireducens]|jgi:hypothetical protein|uniref:Uncharacterized protein n=1 Tax=Orenia metallireducens TaxID=1413210 RepID=A0A285H1X0_9FIRM|nr:hypothetical protein [Orenia metallireducens]PRX29434.1 hypothetical protein BX659_10918 [Orenia metallireducens]SNY29809.1 hypothetical protein SAMN06265827_11318 [Orenia metallireducens]
MDEELVKLLIGIAVIIISIIVLYIRSGSKKSLYEFVLSSLMKFWDRLVKLLVVVAVIWFGVRVVAHLLRRIL